MGTAGCFFKPDLQRKTDVKNLMLDQKESVYNLWAIRILKTLGPCIKNIRKTT